MTDTELTSLFAAYLKAFATTSEADSDRLLRSSVAADVFFTNPGIDGRGLQQLLKHTVQFQARFPGQRFRLNWCRQQHDQFLAEWTQMDADGRGLLTGHSYGRLNERGCIVYLAGFWSPGAV